MRRLLFIPLLALVFAPAAFADGGTLTISDPTPHYGETVSFSYTVPGGASRYAQRLTVLCNDGVSEVYQASQPAGQPFTLSGAGWSGQAADCQAQLFYVDKRGSAHFTAYTEFHVSA